MSIEEIRQVATRMKEMTGDNDAWARNVILLGDFNIFEPENKTFQEIIPTCKVYFTPQPLFFETTTEWAATLHEIYNGADAQKALDGLVKKLEGTLKRAGY